MEIDVRGRSCPIPLLTTRKALRPDVNRLTVLVSSGTARAHVVSLLRDEGFDVAVQDEAAGYRIVGSRKDG
jgi:tRNA 2-thiouridine synthesizing protein A